ncbi:MAG: histidine kinase [Acidobacteria bacterium]|nr:histidine kinase [Acidobacteriota bacterium]
MDHSRWLIIGLYTGVWTLIGLVSASKATLLYVRFLTVPVSRTTLVLWQLVVWYAWGLLTPLVLLLGRRFPLERGKLGRNALLHLIGGFAFAATHMAFSTFMGRLVLPVDMGRLPFLTVFRNTALQDLPFELMIYGGVLGSGYAFSYYRRFRERELAAAQLQQQLAEAQLQALKMQLHPHFLFNTLNTIAALVRQQDNDTAVRMLAGLGDLLRYALAQADKQEVPLQQEIEFIEQYLELEQMRLGDRLTIHLQIAADALDAAVPNLMLQPLVENAVKHGIAPRANGGRIEISAWRTPHQLHLQVSDDGSGLAATANAAGLGLANTRARLASLYGTEHEFTLQNSAGLTVKIVIPYRAANSTGLTGFSGLTG